jgi:hypothetical protein
MHGRELFLVLFSHRREGGVSMKWFDGYYQQHPSGFEAGIIRKEGRPREYLPQPN